MQNRDKSTHEDQLDSQCQRPKKVDDTATGRTNPCDSIPTPPSLPSIPANLSAPPIDQDRQNASRKSCLKSAAPHSVPTALGSRQKRLHSTLPDESQIDLLDSDIPTMDRPAAKFNELASGSSGEIPPLSTDPRFFALPNVDERITKGLPNRTPSSVNVPQNDSTPFTGGESTQPQQSIPVAFLHGAIEHQRNTLCPDMCSCATPLSYRTVSDPKTFESLMRAFAFDTSVLDQYRTITQRRAFLEMAYLHGQILTASAERELMLLDAHPCDPVFAFEQAMVYEMPHRVATIMHSARHHIRARDNRDPPCKKNGTPINPATLSNYCGPQSEKRKREEDTTPSLRSAVYRRPVKRRLIVEGELAPNFVLLSSFDPAAPTALGPGLLNPEFIPLKPSEPRGQKPESEDEDEEDEPEWDYNDVSPTVQAQATNAPFMGSVQPPAQLMGPDRPSVLAVEPGTTPWHTHGPLHDIFGAHKPANATLPVTAPSAPVSSPQSADSVVKDEAKPQLAVVESEGEEGKEDRPKGDSEDQ